MSIKKSKSTLEAGNLTHNIVRLLKDRKTTEAEVSAALGLPVLTIRRLSNGDTTDPHVSTLQQLAEHFDVSIDALINTTASMPVQLLRAQNKPHFLPILDWQTAAEMEEVSTLDLSAWQDWHTLLPLSSPLSDKAFVLKSTPSMHPKFPLGTLFTVDPMQPPLDGDLVIIKMIQDGSLSLREISIDAPRWQLKPIIAGSDTMFYDSTHHHIVGPVVLSTLLR